MNEVVCCIDLYIVKPQLATFSNTARTLHNVILPLRALRGTCDVVRDSIQHQIKLDLSTNKDNDKRNCRLLEQASDAVTITTRMVADVSDLARFHEGANLNTDIRRVPLRDVGLEAIERIQVRALKVTDGNVGITVSLKLIGDGGPADLQTDKVVLLRVLSHLLENAVREVDSGGQVTLTITSNESNILFEVIDNGNGLPLGTCLDQGSGFNDIMVAAPIHRNFIDTSKLLSCNDPADIQKVRAQMEEKLRDLKQNGVGVGLPLSYHLVRSLGGDLRNDPLYAKKGTRVWFVLPSREVSESSEVLETETIFKQEPHPSAVVITEQQERCGIKRKHIKSPFTHEKDIPLPAVITTEQWHKYIDDPNSSHFSCDGSITSDIGSNETYVSFDKPAVFAVATHGVRASLPFSVLIVEDADICKSSLLIPSQMKSLNRNLTSSTNI